MTSVVVALVPYLVEAVGLSVRAVFGKDAMVDPIGMLFRVAFCWSSGEYVTILLDTSSIVTLFSPSLLIKLVLNIVVPMRVVSDSFELAVEEVTSGSTSG